MVDVISNDSTGALDKVSAVYDAIAETYDEAYGVYNKRAQRQDKRVMMDLIDAGIESRTVVDLGCGTGLFLDEIEKFDKVSYKKMLILYTGIDISQGMVKQAKRKHMFHGIHHMGASEYLKLVRNHEDDGMWETASMVLSMYGGLSYLDTPEIVALLEGLTDHEFGEFYVMLFGPEYEPSENIVMVEDGTGFRRFEPSIFWRGNGGTGYLEPSFSHIEYKFLHKDGTMSNPIQKQIPDDKYDGPPREFLIIRGRR